MADFPAYPLPPAVARYPHIPAEALMPQLPPVPRPLPPLPRPVTPAEVPGLSAEETLAVPVTGPAALPAATSSRWWEGAVASHACDGPPAYWIRITPELAGEWRKRNLRNRPRSEVSVLRYTRDVATARWIRNGQTIAFDTDGILVNGQNRLEAIEKAGVAADCLVVFDVPMESRRTTDDGRIRRPGDNMAMELGVTCSQHVAAALGVFLRFEFATLERRSLRPTNTEMLDLVRMLPGLRDSVTATGHYRGFGGTAALAFCHYLLHRLDPEQAEPFFDQAFGGLGLVRGSVTERLHVRARKLPDSPRKQQLQADQIRLVFSSFAKFRRGQAGGRSILVPKESEAIYGMYGAVELEPGYETWYGKAVGHPRPHVNRGRIIKRPNGGGT